jgi:hypothetical protein
MPELMPAVKPPGTLIEGRRLGQPEFHALCPSEVFPGLWLDPQALINGDTRRLRAVLDLGFATPQDAEFVARLAEATARLTE